MYSFQVQAQAEDQEIGPMVLLYLNNKGEVCAAGKFFSLLEWKSKARTSLAFSSEASFGLPVLSSSASVCVCVSITCLSLR